jgi:hypothetical protein
MSWSFLLFDIHFSLLGLVLFKYGHLITTLESKGILLWNSSVFTRISVNILRRMLSLLSVLVPMATQNIAVCGISTHLSRLEHPDFALAKLASKCNVESKGYPWITIDDSEKKKQNNQLENPFFRVWS